MTDYATSAELKSFLRIDAADTSEDAEIAFALTAASRAIDRFANRQFGVVASAEARTFTGRYDSNLKGWVVDVDDFMTATGLVIKTDEDIDLTFETTLTETPLKLPLNADKNGMPWKQLLFREESLPSHIGGVEVTAKWGWTAIPDAITEACLIQAARLMKRRDAPFGVAGSPEMGNELRLLSELDPDVKVLVSTYRKWWAAA
jgi:hypothetical protein